MSLIYHSSPPKITEKDVLSQLSVYLTSNNLFPVSQSAYCLRHGSEMALVKVMTDILRPLGDGDASLVVALLDFSAAFDTTDYSILLQRHEHLYGNLLYTSQLVHILPFQQNTVC